MYLHATAGFTHRKSRCGISYISSIPLTIPETLHARLMELFKEAVAGHLNSHLNSMRLTLIERIVLEKSRSINLVFAIRYMHQEHIQF